MVVVSTSLPPPSLPPPSVAAAPRTSLRSCTGTPPALDSLSTGPWCFATLAPPSAVGGFVCAASPPACVVFVAPTLSHIAVPVPSTLCTSIGRLDRPHPRY
uniref:Uncharacterized protein n=1 Tax=Lygus hesperus TaxID=30085 RepID=A0A0A9YK24_LYGHE